jgi:phage tail sheath protein FI
VILNDKTAAQYFGTARDGYTIPQALDAIRDQQSDNSGYGAVIVVNAFDPDIHKTRHPNEARH